MDCLKIDNKGGVRVKRNFKRSASVCAIFYPVHLFLRLMRDKKICSHIHELAIIW